MFDQEDAGEVARVAAAGFQGTVQVGEREHRFAHFTGGPRLDLRPHPTGEPGAPGPQDLSHGLFVTEPFAPQLRDPPQFPQAQGQKRHKPLSNMAMLMLLRRMNVEGVTVHGFRSTFRDWASEVGNAPREVAEMSLSHRIGSDVERAYARSDLLEKRRNLMERWSAFVTGTVGKVINLPVAKEN